jgi:hypothetical protein
MIKKFIRLSGLNILASFLAFFLLIPSNSGAVTFCKCVPVGEVKNEFDRAFTVFSGKVKNIKWKGGNYDHIIFEVGDVWKGDLQKETKIMTERPSLVERFFENSISCGYMFAEGEEYLVYSYRDKLSPAKVSNCGRTKKLSEAGKELAILNDIKSSGNNE